MAQQNNGPDRGKGLRPGEVDLHRILRARTTALAAPKAAEPPTDVLDLIVFRIGSERYAVEAVEAGQAIEVSGATMLPGVPSFYRGLISHQGIVYPLLDIRPLVGTPVNDGAQPAQALLFVSDERTIALAADAIESFVRVDATTLAAVSSIDEAGTGPVRGMMIDSTIVLDVRTLFADARLVIDHHSPISEQSVRGAT